MADYPYFPMFVDLSHRRVVVVGAGSIAERRVATLTQFTPHIAVVAPQVCPGIEALAASGAIVLRRKPYEEADLDGADMVVAATDDAALNAAIYDACRRRGIVANVASDRTLCDFYFPGIAREGNIVVGISASGEDHRRARRITEAVRGMIAPANDGAAIPDPSNGSNRDE